ncbi:hypothetical protein ADK98_09420 [Streptomyces sp. H036]|nr:hypothetical protein ADK98_09420 [Streptomyces sp. H036]
MTSQSGPARPRRETGVQLAKGVQVDGYAGDLLVDLAQRRGFQVGVLGLDAATDALLHGPLPGGHGESVGHPAAVDGQRLRGDERCVGVGEEGDGGDVLGLAPAGNALPSDLVLGPGPVVREGAFGRALDCPRYRWPCCVP